MPQEPKKRHSRQRQGKRRHSINYGIPQGIICSNCRATIIPHTICSKCGYYQDRQIINKEKKPKKDEESTRPQT